MEGVKCFLDYLSHLQMKSGCSSDQLSSFEERTVTGEVFGELLLQLVGSIEGLLALIICQPLVHLPGQERQVRSWYQSAACCWGATLT